MSCNYSVFHARTTAGFFPSYVSRDGRAPVEETRSLRETMMTILPDRGWCSLIHSPRVTLRSFRLFRHAPRRNKSFRGTVRPETDFVRFALLILNDDNDNDDDDAVSWPRGNVYLTCTYRARNNSPLLGFTTAKQISWPSAKNHRTATQVHLSSSSSFAEYLVRGNIYHIMQTREVFQLIAF